MRLLKICFFSLFIISCATPRVTYDYDRNVDYDNYKSYNFYPDIRTGLNQLDDKRFFTQIDSVMQLKGLYKSEAPDIYVNIIVREYEIPSQSAVGIGIGTGGRNTRVGVSGGIPVGSSRIGQEITIDLIDVKRNELYWQATAKGRMPINATPFEREQYYKAMANKIFGPYPPKVKAKE
ncbi:DUF4136 domain-containing protein [Leptobacterium sp. I13]|uniref:DUF4136 domain-containing protein n=1 Tax=Leptobacterium meishanense TaxID=3128904 RepID=UPI0030EC22DC